jgi:hypothetical protein
LRQLDTNSPQLIERGSFCQLRQIGRLQTISFS